MTAANSELSACWWDQELEGLRFTAPKFQNESEKRETKTDWEPQAQKGNLRLDMLPRGPTDDFIEGFCS